MNNARDALYMTPAMVAALGPEAHVRQMLVFEAALADVEARAAVIPSGAAKAIIAQCRLEAFDVDAIYREAIHTGSPVIPLVRMLSDLVAPEGRQYVHWGATSQDVIDTAMVLQMRDGLVLLESDLLDVCVVCAKFADLHRYTLMAGRTLMQQAVPIPFGLKAARWLGMLSRQVEALREQRRALALQFGGAAGTLAALGDRGLDVAALLATELGLVLPDAPWHAERDRIAGIAGTLSVVAGTVAKIAQDIVLLAQTEVGEVAEGPAAGKGGSSAMPQKHNPVGATLTLAAARLALGQAPLITAAMVQEHERAAGSWQAEWAAVPNLFCYTAGAIAHLLTTVQGLQIDTDRMRKNLDCSNGLVMAEGLAMALAPHIGRLEAQRIVQDVCRRVVNDDRSLGEVAGEDPNICAVLSAKEIESAVDPTNYLGSAEKFIERVLVSYHELRMDDE